MGVMNTVIAMKMFTVKDNDSDDDNDSDEDDIDYEGLWLWWSIKATIRVTEQVTPMFNIAILCCFGVFTMMGNEYHLHPVHSGESSLMFKFSRHYSGQDLAALNIVRQHKKIIHLSCIVLCNGQTINKAYLTSAPGVSHLHKFPLQQLTQSN